MKVIQENLWRWRNKKKEKKKSNKKENKNTNIERRKMTTLEKIEIIEQLLEKDREEKESENKRRIES